MAKGTRTPPETKAKAVAKVLASVPDPYSTREIAYAAVAQELGVAPSTVQTWVSRASRANTSSKKAAKGRPKTAAEPAVAAIPAANAQVPEVVEHEVIVPNEVLAGYEVRLEVVYAELVLTHEHLVAEHKKTEDEVSNLRHENELLRRHMADMMQHTHDHFHAQSTKMMKVLTRT